MADESDDLLADFLARRREAHRQRIVAELIERFEKAKGRGSGSVEEIRAFIAEEVAAARRIAMGKRE
jgi:hypothetical protein